MAGEHWTDEPEAQDFPAAESYRSSLIGPAAAAKLVKALRKERTLQYYAAKDILRAAGLPLLGPTRRSPPISLFVRNYRYAAAYGDAR